MMSVPVIGSFVMFCLFVFLCFVDGFCFVMFCFGRGESSCTGTLGIELSLGPGSVIGIRFSVLRLDIELTRKDTISYVVYFFQN